MTRRRLLQRLDEARDAVVATAPADETVYRERAIALTIAISLTASLIRDDVDAAELVAIVEDAERVLERRI